MGYLSAASRDNLLSRPETISDLYAETRAAFVADLGPAFAAQCEDHLRLAFCSVVAFDLKPYGGCTVLDLAGLLASPVLDCDNYVSLTWHLFKLMRPTSPTNVAAIGWDGGAVGNHAQMQAQTPGSPDILLDPTIGLVVHGCSIDFIVGTYVYPTNCMASFFRFNSRPNIDAFEARVRDAVANSKYRASDLMYFVADHATLINLPVRSHWLTPRA
ncbi:MAG: hypothetical protein KIT76_17215 [Pseudolabrys sp.]|nr:hypothetical protein [Pseudolabrys sp.]